ncbi:hypothetical protein [Marixanthomonas spongiae]|uniref:Uncharacterized protein n=1 Tax=Marixanthomonas spongiae TaxID=2174845 RepID=A0A2U0HVJ9_9FLAO|nr:hypothetical protein [Marixanthomonas spongiae]PVW12849.1 hypothetical protein DDV96_14590 [Marixanthomonas spongiae]
MIRICKLHFVLAVLLFPLALMAQELPGINAIEEIYRAYNNEDYYQVNTYLKKFGMNEKDRTKKNDATIYFNKYNLKNNIGKRNLSITLGDNGKVGVMIRNADEELYKYYINTYIKAADTYDMRDNVYFFKKDNINIATIFSEQKIYFVLTSLNKTKLEKSTKSKSPVSSGTITVNSTKLTGIYLNKGDKINLKASGRITLGFFAGAAGPEGINGFEIYNIVRNYRHGSLIATIGENGTWFYVGKKATLTADTSGYLKLYANDVDPGNNSGSFKVAYTKL